MADSKKLIGYTGSETTVSIPTSVENVLVRDIANSTFTSTTVSNVTLDTYANDISGAPWGAQNVVWMKEPTCIISFDANGGTGSMDSQLTNVGMAYKLPQCAFIAPDEYEFKAWGINDVEVLPENYYAFSMNTEVLARWKALPPKKWKNNDKSTWAEANAEGWLGSDNVITGFSGTLVASSTYNIPRMINGTTMTFVSNQAFNSQFNVNEIGGIGINKIGAYAFKCNSALTEISFPNCNFVDMGAFQWCSSLKSIELPMCSSIGEACFFRATALSEVSFPECTFIGRQCFCWTAISNIELPKCKLINHFGFMSCPNLTMVSLPVCSYIFYEVFNDCQNLTTVYFLSSSTIICYTYDEFENCPNLTSIYVPASLVDKYKTSTNLSYYSSYIVAYQG